MSEEPIVISTDRAPRSASPISQGIRGGPLIFVSGQLGIDPASMKKVSGGIAKETEQALRNVEAVLEQAGASMANVVKTTCFIANNDDFAVFNEAYAKFFPGNRPARSTVEVGLTGGYLVEVEAIAYIPRVD
jgi:2-iminobutanoate/2-iminopropanoate deaminase